MAHPRLLAPRRAASLVALAVYRTVVDTDDCEQPPAGARSVTVRGGPIRPDR